MYLKTKANRKKTVACVCIIACLFGSYAWRNVFLFSDLLSCCCCCWIVAVTVTVTVAVMENGMEWTARNAISVKYHGMAWHGITITSNLPTE
jgi:hypothetical protein